MTGLPPISPADQLLLDQFVDGLLAPPERDAFERRVQSEPVLRDALAQQRALDAAISRLYAYPESAAANPTAPVPAPTPAPATEAGPGPFRLTRRLGWLSGLAAAIVIASIALFLYQPSGLTFREPDALYAQYQAAGFKPAWKCENDQEFADAVAFYLGSAVVVPQATPGVEVIGWSYADEFGKGTPISQQTLSLFTRVEGQNVLVLMDRAERDRRLSVDPDSGLRLFRREVNNLVLYEVTPLDRPRVLPQAIPATPTPRGGEPPEPAPFDPEAPGPARPPE
ncbi:MAG: hypothetical protein SFY69_12295 [Planctomycetota bacterium]|nr:hypothetical protein [Planctomycetota bacterium]